MMARVCEACKRVIAQEHNQFIELQVRVLDTTKAEEQDEYASCYADVCDMCLSDGTALAFVLKAVDWTRRIRIEEEAGATHG